MKTTRPETRTWHRRISQAIAVLIFASCANVLTYRTLDPDMWGHIQYGEDWLAQGELARIATRTYAAPDHRWINHENLSELAMAITHRVVGGLGLVVGKTLLGLAILVTMFVNARRQGVSTIVAAACMMPVAGGLAEFFCVRPQLASFIAMTATIIILDRSFADWYPHHKIRLPTLMLLLPTMLVWTNAHGGFLAGIGVTFAYLGARALEAMWAKRGESRGTVLRLAALAAGVAGVTLINPYHANLHQWLLYSLGQARPEISEWVSIFDGGVTLFPFAVLTALTLFAVLGTRIVRDPAQGLVFTLVLLQTCHHCRHLPFLALVFGFWIPVHLQSALLRFTPRRSAARDPAALSKSGLVLLGFQGFVVAGLLGGALIWQFTRFGVPRGEFPVAAIQYMADKRLSGKIVVTFDWAQYTLAALPDSLVGFDGRFRTCYPQRVVDMNFDLTLGDIPEHRNRSPDSNEVEPTRVLAWGEPDFVLIDRIKNPSAVEVMEKQDAWVLLYQDGLAQLYGRAHRFDDPNSDDYIPLCDRSLSDTPQSGIAPWPAFPGRSGRGAFRAGATACERLSQAERR